MNEIEANQTLGLHLKGEFDFHGNPNSKFCGPIKKGLRVMFWGKSAKIVTSCSFIKDYQMLIGDKGIVDIVIFSPQSIDKRITLEGTYSIGSPSGSIGEFTIKEILGKWEGKIP